MAVVRRSTDKDATWARAWTADTEAELTGIAGPRHGDAAYATDTGLYYRWQDDGTWVGMPTFYKEGVFTPGLTFGGGSTGMLFAAQNGHYTRIGNIVCIQCRVALTAKGSSTGAAVITGLPYTMSSSQPDGPMQILMNNVVSMNVPVAFVLLSSTSITLQNFNGTTRVNMTDANVANNSVFHITAFYRAA